MNEKGSVNSMSERWLCFNIFKQLKKKEMDVTFILLYVIVLLTSTQYADESFNVSLEIPKRIVWFGYIHTSFFIFETFRLEA